ncbi:hypothetical protein POM88_043311 [Heracleum sosnowskyi]|uniref:F-box domain-containing protein n=1 Tax=Heracleum sosnowskyi TaxID=360622 RepID=A0AAD8H0S7_9APIA|nr:hypothetical protein POM88_043311 [Heracleum sosnowskyi]
MGSRAKKKVRTKPDNEGEDRISGLPDELIHKIYSFLDAKEAVQASVLSKRWKLIWTTLPCLGFGRYDSLPFDDISRYTMFIRHVLSNRNHDSHLSELKMYVPEKLTVKRSVSNKRFRGCVIDKFIQYAISHNVHELNIYCSMNNRRKPIQLSTFSSNSMKKLTLDMLLHEDFALDLPALTTLHLKKPYRYNRNVPESLFTFLPALRTLCLDSSDLSEMSFSLPNLTTLHLDHCRLPRRVWDLPALLSLHLDHINLRENMSEMFSSLVNLKHLTLYLRSGSTERDHSISCPLLLNLDIRTDFQYRSNGKIVVSAPQLCNFSSFGIFSIKVEALELENVEIKLKGWFKYVGNVDKKKYYQRFTSMLSGLRSAKNLSFDLESIEALSEIINIQASVSSPFINLKYLKLPKEYKESSLSSALKSYLLGDCPRATIVTSMAQNNRIHQTRAVSLVDAKGANQTDPLVGGVGNDPVSSSKGNRDFGLWQGHEVHSDFVCLLDRIMHKYPKTFEHFTTKNKKLCTMNLNMLCTTLNDFTKISMTEVSSEMIVEYRDVFACLQNQGFDISWLVNRLNYIEHLRFSKPLIPELHAIDCDIQDLQALRMAKMTEIQNAFGTMGTDLAAGSIGYDLLSGP